jgi:hypothetical protein
VTPTDKQALIYDLATGKVIWGNPGASSVPLLGDLTGSTDSNTLSKIQGITVSANAPANGDYFSFNGTAWVPAPLPTPTVTLAGEVTGANGSTVVAKLLGTPLSGTPADGNVMTVVGGHWVPAAPSAVTSVSMGGDASGLSNAMTVVALQGHAVSATAPTSNQILSFNAGTYTPQSVGGDLSGPISSLAVNSLKGITLDLTAAATNYVLTYDGSKFIMAPQASSPTNYPMTGDVSGTTDASTVAKIQGHAVSNSAPSDKQVMTWVSADSQWEPKAANSNATTLQTKAVSATSPTDKQVLTWNATDSAWEPTTPTAATSVVMAGDVTSNSNTSVVARINGFNVAATAPTDKQALIFNTSNNQWQPTTIPAQNPTLGGDLSQTASTALIAKLQGYTLSLTGTPLSGQAVMWDGSEFVFGNPTSTATAVTMAGDVTSQSNTSVVGKIQGNAVKAGTPSDQQFMTWVTANSDWEAKTYTPPAAPANYAMAGDVSGTTAASTLSKIGGITITGAPTNTGQALIYNGTSFIWTNPQAAANAIEIQGFNVANTAPSGGQGLFWNATTSQYEPGVATVAPSAVPLTGDVTGTAAASVVGKIQGIAVKSGTPTDGQSLVYSGTDSKWEATSPVVPTHRVSWQFADTVNTLTTTSGSAPNLAVNTGASSWAIQSVYCISDDSSATTFQLTTSGTNIGTASFSCTSTGSSSTSLAVTSVGSGATISQSIISPSAALHHMTVVVVYQ